MGVASSCRSISSLGRDKILPRFDNSFVSVVLPDGWRDDSDADIMAFANPVEAEELTISFGQFKERIDAAHLYEMVWHLTQQKAAALTRLTGEKLEIIEVSRTPPDVSCVANFGAFGNKSAVYARVVVTGHPDHFITVSYYLRNCTAVTMGVATRAQSVIQMCHDNTAV